MVSMYEIISLDIWFAKKGIFNMVVLEFKDSNSKMGLINFWETGTPIIRFLELRLQEDEKGLRQLFWH